MAEDLSVEHDCWWHALVAHTQGVRFVVSAIIVHFVADVLHKCTVLTLSVRRVALFTFFSLLNNPVIKAFVLKDLFLGLNAIRTLSTGWVLA